MGVLKKSTHIVAAGLANPRKRICVTCRSCLTCTYVSGHNPVFTGSRPDTTAQGVLQQARKPESRILRRLDPGSRDKRKTGVTGGENPGRNQHHVSRILLPLFIRHPLGSLRLLVCPVMRAVSATIRLTGASPKKPGQPLTTRKALCKLASCFFEG